MCASSPESCEILLPPGDSKPGDVVTVEGFPGTPDAQLNPKRKVGTMMFDFRLTNLYMCYNYQDIYSW